MSDYKYDVINFCYHDLLQIITYFIFYREKFFHLSHIYWDLLHPILHPIATILFGMLSDGHLHISLSYPAILHLVICNILVCCHFEACWSPVCYDTLSSVMVIVIWLWWSWFPMLKFLMPLQYKIQDFVSE